jgi:hypothetical protein
MVIEYENTLDDIVAFNRYQIGASPAANPHLRIHRRRISVSDSVIALTAGGAVLWISHSWIPALAVVAFSAVVPGIVSPHVQKRFQRWLVKTREEQVRKMLAEGKNDSVLGWRRLSLSPETLDEESATGTRSVRYTALGRIVDTPDHVFVYLTALEAVVVPKRNQQPAGVEDFVAELHRRLPNPPLQRT